MYYLNIKLNYCFIYILILCNLNHRANVSASICNLNNEIDPKNITILKVDLEKNFISRLTQQLANITSINICIHSCCERFSEAEDACDAILYSSGYCYFLNCKLENAEICHDISELTYNAPTNSLWQFVKMDSGLLLQLGNVSGMPIRYSNSSLTNFMEKSIRSNFPNDATIPLDSKILTAILTTTSTTQKPLPLEIEIIGNKSIRIPNNNVTLTANIITNLNTEEIEKLNYQWSVTEKNNKNEGQLIGLSNSTLHITKLQIGNYSFMVEVTTMNRKGKAFVNITVLPPFRKNVAPIARVSPVKQTIQLPKELIISGKNSTDDVQITEYKWELINGPITSLSNINPDAFLQQNLFLTGLDPGEYTFKLTVKDSEGAENSAQAFATILKEADLPPKAVAGQSVLLTLPQDSTILNGTGSYDDHRIKSYKWIKKLPNDLQCDMTGSSEAILKLSKMQEGKYVFILTVEDDSGQTNSDEVEVIVQPSHNRHPIAVAIKEASYWLPLEHLILNGTNSTDDTKIINYQWSIISVPEGFTNVLSDENLPVAYLKNPIVGTYKFKLIVEDEGKLKNELEVEYEVKQHPNKAPVVNGGENKTISLPVDVIYLNGSASYDDRGIASYKWIRLASSPAAGEIINGTDQKAILELMNVVPGEYLFNFTVTDSDSVVNYTLVKLIVKKDPKEFGIVQLILRKQIQYFAYSQLEAVTQVLKVAFPDPNYMVYIEGIKEDQSTGGTVILFYVMTQSSNGNPSIIQWANETAFKLKYISINNFLKDDVLSVQTKECQATCSGHGTCDQFTKKCVCETFWTSNIFKANFGIKETNCDWSVLYIIIIVALLGTAVFFMLWTLICLCKKKLDSTTKPRTKRRRYTLLDGNSETKSNGIKSLNNKTKPVKSYTNLESDLSSCDDDETVFPTYPPNEMTRRSKSNSPGRDP